MIRAARDTDVPAVTSDYSSTVLDYLGAEPSEEVEPVDGVSLRPLIERRMKERPRPIGFQSGRMAALSGNRYKLVVPREGEETFELYDLLADPAENVDLASRHPEVVDQMVRELRTWQESCARSSRGEDYKRP